MDQIRRLIDLLKLGGWGIMKIKYFNHSGLAHRPQKLDNLYLKPHKLVYSPLGTRSKRDFISIRLIYLMVYPTLLPNVSCTLDFTWFWKLHIHLTIFCRVLCRLRRNVFSLLLDYLRVCFHRDKVFSFKEK